MRISKALVVSLGLLLSLTPTAGAFGQTAPAPPAAQATTATPRLRGTVADPTGGVMPSVDIAVLRGLTLVKAAKTDEGGAFTFDLAAGDYQLAVTAPDFKVYTQTVRVTPNMRPLAITMTLEGITAVVEVREGAEREVTVDASSSLDATTITADQLKDLPEDEESLLAYLQLLAGGEGNAQLIIDGFEGGRLPTRDQIAQIVIEPNSFNANGTGPRITIVTRSPGPQRWAGGISFQYRDSALNARQPGSATRSNMHRTTISTNYDGPVIKGKWGMRINLSKEQSDSGNNALRAITPFGPVNTSFVSPSTYDNISINNQLYLSQKHTMQVNFGFNRQKSENQGVGNFNLPERASNNKSNGWNFNLSDNLTLTPKMTNTFQFRINRDTGHTRPLTDAIAINVLDAFYGGGAQNFSDNRGSSFNIQNVLRWTPTAKWNLQFAFNANSQYRYNFAQNNFLGTYSFSSLHDYCYAEALKPGGAWVGSECLETKALIDANTPYYTVVSGNGTSTQIPITGRALTFSKSSGDPLTETQHRDANVSIQGTYRISPTMSGSVGLGYTLQNHFKDYNNFSPTASYQVQIKQKTTISIGARMSHPNVGFPINFYEQLLRGDGQSRQFNTSISSPNYPDPFIDGNIGTTTGTGSTLAVRGPNLESPYTLNSQMSVNRQLPKNWRVTVNLNLNRQVHAIRQRNINAPYPGTALDPTLTREEIDRLRPFFPIVTRINQYESVGNSANRNLNFQVQVPGMKRKILGTQIQSAAFRYGLTWAWDDAGAANLYDVRSDWARNDQRHQFQGSLSLRPPKIGTFNFNLNAASGRSYNMTTGKDDNFDQSFSDRPAGVKRNSLRGPGGYTLNLTYNSPQINLRKRPAPAAVAQGAAPTGAAGTPAGGTNIDQLIQSAMAAGINPAQIQQLIASISSQPGFIGGSETGPAQQPSLAYPQLQFSINAQNVLNHTRVNSYSGVVSSPLFGKPTSWSQGRQIYLSLSTRF
jgi:hypothetical protein